MKLGSQTNSLTNHILSRMVIGQPEPVVGMGVTMLGWTDRYPGTITEVLRGGTVIIVQEDRAVRTDQNGMSQSQDYTFFRDHSGQILTYRLGKNGRWEEVFVNPKTGRFKKKTGGKGLRIGERGKYHDFSF